MLLGAAHTSVDRPAPPRIDRFRVAAIAAKRGPLSGSSEFPQTIARHVHTARGA
jgi:hypothetical protein